MVMLLNLTKHQCVFFSCPFSLTKLLHQFNSCATNSPKNKLLRIHISSTDIQPPQSQSQNQGRNGIWIETNLKKMSDYFPEDVVIEILLRLPIKSLVKFRCVCISWRTLLSDPNFIYRYLLFFGCGEGDVSRLLVKHCDNLTEGYVYSTLSYDTLDHISLTESVPNPLGIDDKKIHIQIVCSSCNGLFCLLYNYGFGIVLWNPTTNETEVIPDSHILYPFNSSPFLSSVGFGFDSKTNDYKIVKLLNVYYYKDGVDGRWGDLSDLETQRIEAQMYSLRNGSWKKVDTVVLENYSWWSEPDCQVSTSGAFHCQGMYRVADDGIEYHEGDDDRSEYHEVIVSLDMSNEMFKITPQADAMVTDGLGRSLLYSSRPPIFRLNDSIAKLIYSNNEKGEIESPLDLWVLLEPGVKESWTKLFTIAPISGVKQPLGFWKNSGLFLETDSGLIVYNPTAQKITKSIQINCVEDSLQVLAYMESHIPMQRGSDLKTLKASILKRVTDLNCR